MRRAVVESCDVYFYRLAQDLGISRMHASLGRFGFGRKTGVDLPAESTGLLPSSAWKRRVRHAPWYPGETVITGIGQGYFLATPIQLATATAILANGGRVLPPSVGRHARERGSEAAIALRPPGRVPELGSTPAHLAEVLEAMSDVVNAPNGTARQVGLGSSYRIAGKTGTAQVFRIKQGQTVKNERLPEHLRDHAWFISFAPVEDPRIALVVLVEHGGSGSGAAAPIARKLLDHYLMRGADTRQLTGG
jgi:penicillin-binding protein 2